MRSLLAIGLFLAAVLGTLGPDAAGQTKAKQDPKVKYAPPAPVKPDEATLKTIAEKTKQMKGAVESLKAKKIPDDVLIEVEIFLKAAEYIVKFEEWYHKDSGKWTLATLDRGLERAKQAEGGKAVWRDQAGKWIVRAYRSMVDGSIQPYAVLLPQDYGKDPNKKWRLDVVLHGRDSSISEAKFIATHDVAKAAPQEFVQLDVYGRGNNAYRWAGEVDVYEAIDDFANSRTIDPNRVVLRGFSMGGAGTWHLGLHNPFAFAVMGPGAGFTTTHGYIKDLPNPLPEYQEKCLSIYDAYRYAENVFNIPVVAYSGEIDAQKLAADNIEKLVKAYPEPLRFTHIVAPGLAHSMPAEWQAKAQAEYQKYVGPGQSFPSRIRFVTYTLRFSEYGWGRITGLEEHYKKSVIDGEWTADKLSFRTENIRSFQLSDQKDYDKWNGKAPAVPAFATVDGQRVELPKGVDFIRFTKSENKWRAAKASGTLIMDAPRMEKMPGMQGPIDDAFRDGFVVVGPEKAGWNEGTDAHARGSQDRFAREWQKWMRGTLPTSTSDKLEPSRKSLILFGDPASNPVIAKVLEHLPITWTKEKLVVNGVTYDPKTHVPVLVFPHPAKEDSYVVINSGHTFHEADFKGTNALLYPRLGDWAVLKPMPTAKDPAAAEVVAAGLFDEFWQFPKK